MTRLWNMHPIMRPTVQRCHEHRLGRPHLLSTTRQPGRIGSRLRTSAWRRRQRSVEVGPGEESAQQPVQQVSEPKASEQGTDQQELDDKLWQQPGAAKGAGQQQQQQQRDQQQQEQDPAHHAALEARQEEQEQQHQQEQGRQQVEGGPEERQQTAEVSAEDAVPTRAEAWQAVHGYARQLEVQATRSPGTVLTTVAAVAVGAALLGNLLRRYLFKPSPARAPTLEELVLRYKEQTGELRPVRGQGTVPEPTAEAKEAGMLELGPLVQEKDEWTAEKEARALRLEQMAAEAAGRAGGAEAATIDVEATGMAGPLTGEQRGGAVSSPGVAPSQNGAARVMPGASSQGSTASRDQVVSQAAKAEPAAAAAAAAEPAATGAPAPVAAVHPLAVQPEVFILRQGAKSKAGVRIMFELQGQQLYCPIVFQDQADAQALRGPLATLFGAILTPEDLPVVATPTASLLELAAEGSQAIAFYPAGALLQLSLYSAEALADAVEDEDKAQQFDDELQLLLRKQGQVLPAALVRQLAHQAQQRAKLEQAQQQHRAQQAQQQQQQEQEQQEQEQQQRSGQNDQMQGHQPQQHRARLEGGAAPAPVPAQGTGPAAAAQGMGAAAAEAAPAQGTGAAPAAQGAGASSAAHGAGASSAPLPMDWWLSLPVVHVPQLCYEDGAQGLMVVPVASLSGALRKAAGAFGGGNDGDQESGSRSSNNGNGAAASSNGSGPARDHQGRSQQQQHQSQREQQGELSRPVERHVVAFKDLDDARALSLCALQSEQGGSAVKVQALALQPQQLLRLAQSAGYTVTVLPKGAVPISPGDRFEGVVARLHDAVQDLYWASLAEGLQAFDEAEKQQREEGGKGEAWE